MKKFLKVEEHLIFFKYNNLFTCSLLNPLDKNFVFEVFIVRFSSYFILSTEDNRVFSRFSSVVNSLCSSFTLFSSGKVTTGSGSSTRFSREDRILKSFIKSYLNFV